MSLHCMYQFSLVPSRSWGVDDAIDAHVTTHQPKRIPSSKTTSLDIIFSSQPAVQLSYAYIHLSPDLPSVKPSAIALGTIFNHAASLAVLGPVFGDTYHRAQAANSKEEFVRSKEAASAAAAWGTSLVGSAVQSYGVGALINATGTLSYKGAAYLGSLIFMASSAPSVCFSHPLLPQSSSLCPKSIAKATANSISVYRPSIHWKATSRHCCGWCPRPRLWDSRPFSLPHVLGHKNQPLWVDTLVL